LLRKDKIPEMKLGRNTVLNLAVEEELGRHAHTSQQVRPSAFKIYRDKDIPQPLKDRKGVAVCFS
jgi:hypothetical protein